MTLQQASARDIHLGVALPLGRLRVEHAVERCVLLVGLLPRRLCIAAIAAAAAIWACLILEADVVPVRPAAMGGGVLREVSRECAAGAGAALFQCEAVLEDDARAQRRAAGESTVANSRGEQLDRAYQSCGALGYRGSGHIPQMCYGQVAGIPPATVPSV
jgi:hypothetical protein